MKDWNLKNPISESVVALFFPAYMCMIKAKDYLKNVLVSG